MYYIISYIKLGCRNLKFFFNFGPILTGFSREGRSWAKGDRKNIGVKKYPRGCHGNVKNRLSGHISPGNQSDTLSAYSSGVYGPMGTKLTGKAEGMCTTLTDPLVSMATMLFLRKLENALMPHTLVWVCWNLACEVNYPISITQPKMSKIYHMV